MISVELLIDVTPIYSEVEGQVVFQDPADFEDTEFGEDDELPAVYGEVILNGQLLEAQTVIVDGSINVEDVSLIASGSIAFFAGGGIYGLSGLTTIIAPELIFNSNGERIS